MDAARARFASQGPNYAEAREDIAKTTRAIRDGPERALPIQGITNNPDAPGT